MTDIDQGEEIGSGGSATVFKGSCNLNGVKTAVALKYFRSGCNSNVIANECNVLRRLSHDNIIQMFSYKPSPRLLILEYCSIIWENNELHNLEEWAKNYYNRMATVDCRLFKQILSDLNYLHSNNKLHCDMKPSNCSMKNDISGRFWSCI